MRLIAKVWRSLLHRDFQTWSPEMGAMYRHILGRRKIIGFEWEVPYLGPNALPLQDNLCKYLKTPYIDVGVDGGVDGGVDEKFTEIRVGYKVDNPKWVMDLYNTYYLCYQHGVLPTGYHLSYNAPRKSTERREPAIFNNRPHRKMCENYHGKCWGTPVRIVTKTARNLTIADFPYLFQFKSCMASITPQQVLFDTILRHQLILGIEQKRFRYNKIEDMAAVLLSATPHSFVQLFNYPSDCHLGDLVEKQKRTQSGQGGSSSSSPG